MLIAHVSSKVLLGTGRLTIAHAINQHGDKGETKTRTRPGEFFLNSTMHREAPVTFDLVAVRGGQ